MDWIALEDAGEQNDVATLFPLITTKTVVRNFILHTKVHLSAWIFCVYMHFAVLREVLGAFSNHESRVEHVDEIANRNCNSLQRLRNMQNISYGRTLNNRSCVWLLCL